MKIITTFNEKGGVAKTTLSWLLGEVLTYCENDIKVLLIDNDRQRNLTQNIVGKLKINEISAESNSLNVYKGLNILDNIVFSSFKNLHLVPGSKELREVYSTKDLNVIKNALSPLMKGGEAENYYKYIIIDNRPQNDELTNASIIASDIVLTPFDSDASAFDAICEVEDFIKNKYPEKYPNLRYVPAKFQISNTGYAYLNAARKMLKAKVTKTEIPFNHDIENTKTKKEPMSLFIKKIGRGKTADAYIDLACELFGYNRGDVTRRIIIEKRERKSMLARKNFHKFRKKAK